MHLRKLLVLTTLCWVAPLSAQQRAPVPESAERGWACPHELEAERAITISTRDPVGEVPIEASRRAFLP